MGTPTLPDLPRPANAAHPPSPVTRHPIFFPFSRIIPAPVLDPAGAAGRLLIDQMALAFTRLDRCARQESADAAARAVRNHDPGAERRQVGRVAGASLDAPTRPHESLPASVRRSG